MNEDYNEYTKAMKDLQFSAEAKERMTQNVAHAAMQMPAVSSSTPITRKRKSWHYIAAAAAAAALVLAVGGGAYASGALMSMANVFDDIFGGAPAQTDVIDKIGRPIGASVSSGGMTVTAEAIVGDKTNFVVVYSIAKDDGSAFDLPEPLNNGVIPLYFETANLRADGELGGGGSAYFYDANPEDNAIQYVQEMSVNMDGGSLVGKTARASFENLKAQDGTETRTLAEDNWNLKFTIDYEDTSESIPAGQTIDLNGMDATIDAISISPIAVTVNYTVKASLEPLEQESGRMTEDGERELKRFSPDIVVNLKDGTEVDASNGAWGSNQSNNQTVCYKNALFPRFLNLEDIESISVGSATVTLP